MNLKMNSKGIVVDYIKSLIKDLFDIDSHYNYYDEKTHWYLGEFLRKLNKEYSINLLNHYNVYSGKMIDNYRISATNGKFRLVEQKTNDKFNDLIVIQVKPNTTYSLYFDTTTKGGVEGQNIIITTAYYDGFNFIQDSLDNEMLLGRCSYDTPIKFTTTVDNEENNSFEASRREAEYLNDNLVILIQVPKTCTKRLVIEGDVATHKVQGSTENLSFDQCKQLLVNQNDFITNTTKNPIILDDFMLEVITNYIICDKSDESNILMFQRLFNSPNLTERIGEMGSVEFNRGEYDDITKKWVYAFQEKYINTIPSGYIDKATEQMLLKVVDNE